MVDEIYEAAFNDELEKLASPVFNAIYKADPDGTKDAAKRMYARMRKDAVKEGWSEKQVKGLGKKPLEFLQRKSYTNIGRKHDARMKKFVVREYFNKAFGSKTGIEKKAINKVVAEEVIPTAAEVAGLSAGSMGGASLATPLFYKGKIGKGKAVALTALGAIVGDILGRMAGNKIKQKLVQPELKKVALNVGNRVIQRGERHHSELSEPIGTGVKKKSYGSSSSSSSSGFKYKKSTTLGHSLGKTAAIMPTAAIKKVLSGQISPQSAAELKMLGSAMAPKVIKKKERR